MIPARPLLYLSLAWALLGAMAAFWPSLFELWAGVGVAGIALAVNGIEWM